MTAQYVAVTFALVLLALPLTLIFFVFNFVREKRKRRALENAFAEIELRLLDNSAAAEMTHAVSEAKLADTQTVAERAIALGRTLEAEKIALRSSLSALEERFRPVIDLDHEREAVNAAIARLKVEHDELRSSYAAKKAIYNRLLAEVAVFDEKIAFAEMGVYEPHFDFTDSDEYKRNIEVVRAVQKAMVSDKKAVICSTQWQIEGSISKGRVMTNRNIKLTLRAFNNECDAAIANTRWNNVNAMEKRVEAALSQINSLNESTHVVITLDYAKLKFQELFLTHEHREKLKAEKEERAEAARLQREEQKLIRDLERAEEEEARYQRLLDKAKAEAQSIAGPTMEAFKEQIRILERDLADAHARVEGRNQWRRRLDRGMFTSSPMLDRSERMS